MGEFTRNKIDLIGKWNDIREYLGDSQMLDNLYQYFTDIELEKFINYFDKDYDLFTEKSTNFD